jgi:probable HAF family extracellular repeat protein
MRARLRLAPLIAMIAGAACADPMQSPDARVSEGSGITPFGTGPATFAEAALDLGALPGGRNSGATDLNDQAVVVGTSETAVPGVRHAFVWTAGGGMTDLGTLGGQLSSAAAINNSFEIVGGTSSAAAPFTENVPFIWDPVNGMTALPGVGAASDITDQHVIVGCAAIDATGPQSVRWNRVAGAWVATGLGLPPGGSASACAQAVDNAGRIVGTDQQSTGFFYLNGVYQPLGPGRLAYGISPLNRHVAGEAGLGAVMWPAFNPAGVVTLGYLYTSGFGAALDVNSQAQVVGEVAPPSGSVASARAFYWDCRIGMLELPTVSGGANATAAAWAINASGQSAGISTWIPGGIDRHAVLWGNPVAPPSVVSLPYAPSCTVPPVVSYIPKKFINDGIVSRPGFDATHIDPNSVTIGDGFGHVTPIARTVPGGPPRFSIADVNADGVPDLKISFSTTDMINSGVLTRQSFQLVVAWVDATGLPGSGKYPIRVQ